MLPDAAYVVAHVKYNVMCMVQWYSVMCSVVCRKVKVVDVLGRHAYLLSIAWKPEVLRPSPLYLCTLEGSSMHGLYLVPQLVGKDRVDAEAVKECECVCVEVYAAVGKDRVGVEAVKA